MHSFSELVNLSCRFTLANLKEVEGNIMEELQTSAATPLVKALQMTRLVKVIFAVGVFSIFEAHLQNSLNCKNGFKEAKKILLQAGDTILSEQFSDIVLAINALKHGKGVSYNALIGKCGGTLTSQVKHPSDHFFDEGDLSEVSTLVDVDEKFIERCVEVIEKVLITIQANRPNNFL